MGKAGRFSYAMNASKGKLRLDVVSPGILRVALTIRCAEAETIFRVRLSKKSGACKQRNKCRGDGFTGVMAEVAVILSSPKSKCVSITNPTVLLLRNNITSYDGFKKDWTHKSTY